MGPGAFLLLLELITLATRHGLEAAAGPRSPLLSSPAKEKAGSCPPGRDQDVPPSQCFCLSDASCPGSEKCCKVGRMRTCVQPTTEKPGVCPRERVSLTGLPCTNQCLDDRSCPGNKKCCFSGCGLECVSPPTEQPTACLPDSSGPADNLGSKAQQCSSGEGCSQEDPAKPSLVKPGACPVMLRGSLGPCTETALESCRNDSDCEEAKKCCWTGCRHACAVPDEVHPGTCPPRAAESSTSECDTFCFRDDDCPESQKCCWLSCGRACTAPSPG